MWFASQESPHLGSRAALLIRVPRCSHVFHVSYGVYHELFAIREMAVAQKMTGEKNFPKTGSWYIQFFSQAFF